MAIGTASRPERAAEAPLSPATLVPEQNARPKARRPHALFGGGDLLFMRWVIIAAEIVAVVVFGFALHLPVPFEALTVAILASTLFNLAVTIFHGASAPPSEGENAVYLAFDTLQLAAIFWLTGGSSNPFCLALVLPVRMAGVMLSPRLGGAITVGALALIAGMTIWATPMPWAIGAAITLPLSYRITCGIAVSVGVLFGYGFGRWTARQAARMELALGITETVLAREQRLSALGALAAATAHELGSPLATIAVVARELSRDAPEGPLRDDALLVVSQVSRCRDILQRLAQGPEATNSIAHDIPLSELLRQAATGLTSARSVAIETWCSGPPGVAEPSLRRKPELLHAVHCLSENALDFATTKVELHAAFDAAWVTLNVCDDGPGFAPEILPKLGEPYVTSRADADPAGVEHVGLGLGVFIAKTFLERTGASVSFNNSSAGGAHVAVRWPRRAIELP